MNASHATPQKRFRLKIWLPILIGIVVVGGAIAWYFVAMPFSETQQHARQLDSKAKQLYTDHQTCVERLNQDYEKLNSDNQQAYQKAYDHCESIRQEQNNTVDEYKQLTQT